MNSVGTFRALRHRNFRLFFYGQLLSMSGTWMQRVAVSWLAYELTGSPLLLGYVAFASSAPAILLSPPAGVLADRVNPHRLLIIAQVLGMVQAATLGVLTIAGAMSPWRLVLLSIVLAVITAFENPVRQTFFVQMVTAEDLPNAIALNSSLVSAARVVGPAVAGVVVATYGVGVCFLVNSLSFVAVLVALLAMRLPPRMAAVAIDSGFRALAQGFAFLRRNRDSRSVLVLFAVLNFAGTPYLTLLPVLAGDVLNVGANGLGWLVTTSGVGAVVAAFLMASREHPRGLPEHVRIAAAIFACALALLGLSQFFSVSLLMMALIGGGYIFVVAGTQTLLQTVVSDALRGRVMSFYSLVFVGIPPFGSLCAGWLAEWVGTPFTLLLGGIMCLAAALSYPGTQAEPASPYLYE